MNELSLAVVGINYLNADGSNRRFEVELCAPGEPVELKLEPKNEHDHRAVAVLSTRRVQIGYLTAERCGWIGSRLRAGECYEAIFQQKDEHAAWIRIRFGEGVPTLPPPSIRTVPSDDEWQPDPEGPEWGA